MPHHGIRLDHFYIGLPENEFDDLRFLVPLLAKSRHSTIESKEDSWEGLYFAARSGVYFEVLRARRLGGFGIAYTSFKQELFDVRKVPNELPDLDWRQGTRHMVDGSPWFTWMATCDYLNLDTPCNAWLMHYHSRDIDWSKFQPIPPGIDRFQEFHVKANPRVRDEMLKSLEWLPCTLKHSAHGLEFDLVDKDGLSLAVSVAWDDTVATTQFHMLKFLLCEATALESCQSGPFQINRTQNEVTIVRMSS